MEEPLRILFVIPEVTPFARIGGLGDVVGVATSAGWSRLADSV